MKLLQQSGDHLKQKKITETVDNEINTSLAYLFEKQKLLQSELVKDKYNIDENEKLKQFNERYLEVRDHPSLAFYFRDICGVNDFSVTDFYFKRKLLTINERFQYSLINTIY